MKLFITKFIQSFIYLFVFCSLACAEGLDMNSLQSKLKAIRSLSAEFKQVVHAEGKEISSSSGLMALERPGRFRWQTTKPTNQLVVADGKHLWIYDEDLEQVTIKKQTKSLDGSAALFLSNSEQDLKQDFNILAKKVGTTVIYDLRAKSKKSNFKRMKLTFTADNLSAIEMYDQLGQHTSIHLSRTETNKNIAENQFKFTPPKGTDIVRE